MPNWVKNNLRIKANGEKVLEILEMIKDEDGDMTFAKVSPLPEELKDTTSPVPDNVEKKERKRLQKLYGADNWYDWQCQNWGCKWDASDSGFYERDGYSMVSFETPWSPPREFLEKLSRMFPKVEFEMQFAEEGLGYIGKMTAKNGYVDVHCPEEGADTVEINDRIWDEEWITDWKGEE